jgi:hypothetical protein
MSKTKLFSVVTFLFLGIGILTPTVLPAQFITIARKIKSKVSGDKDIASVILDASSTRVYKAMIDTITAQPKVKITKNDKQKKLVEFTNGTDNITMQVDSVGVNFAQITVTAQQEGTSSKKETDVAVNAILGVCHKVGLHCERKEQ